MFDSNDSYKDAYSCCSRTSLSIYLQKQAEEFEKNVVRAEIMYFTNKTLMN